jgi:hypothetical protein
MDQDRNLSAKFLLDLIRLKIVGSISDDEMNRLCEEVYNVAKVNAANNIRGQLDEGDDDFEVLNLVSCYKTFSRHLFGQRSLSSSVIFGTLARAYHS